MVKSIVIVVAIGLFTWILYANLRQSNEIYHTETKTIQNEETVNKNSGAAENPDFIDRPVSQKRITEIPPKILKQSSPQRFSEKQSPYLSLPVQNEEVKVDEGQISSSTLDSIPESRKNLEVGKYVPPKTEVYVSGGAFYHRVDGTDRNNGTNALLLSQLSFYGDVGLKIHLFTDPLWYMRTQISLSDYRYKKDLSADLISDQNVFAPGLHMGIGKLCWDWFSPEIFVGMDREFFYFSPVLNRIEFDSDWISKIGMATESKWNVKNQLALGFNTLFSYMRFGDTLEDGYELSGGPIVFYRSTSLHFDFQFDHKTTPTLALDTIQVRSYLRYNF